MRRAAASSLLVALVLATLAAAAASAKVDVLPKPKLRPIHAVFNAAPPGQPCAPPYCTTVYTERARGVGLLYTWKVRITRDPACAQGFTGNKPTRKKATWYHADESEGGYCNHTDYDGAGSGHPGVVTVIVTNKDWRCRTKFIGTQGPQAQPVSDGPKPLRCYRRF